MTNKDFFLTVGWIFGLVVLLHGARLLMSWTLVLNGWVVPAWVSVALVVICGYLSYTAFQKKNH